jgi:TPP-dependent 2-oxoacid decarboxylase
MWAAQHYPFDRPRQWINSGGLGTMGFGFPAALGAKRGNPDKTVINITGDGSILMNVQELVTASEYKIPVINVILNNHFLGMVRQWQTFFYDKRYSATDLSYQPNFKALAEACGGIGYDVTTKEEFDAALKDAIEQDKVCFMNVAVNRFENVMPMVPSCCTTINPKHIYYPGKLDSPTWLRADPSLQLLTKILLNMLWRKSMNNSNFKSPTRYQPSFYKKTIGYYRPRLYRF